MTDVGTLGTESLAGTDTPATAPAGTDTPRKTKRSLGLGAWLAIGWLGLVFVLALVADFLPLNDPGIKVADKRLAPFQPGEPLLGTDGNGRDLLARTIYGTRISLVVAVSAVLVGLFIGGLMGLLAGYFRNWFSTTLSSLFDILLAIPQLVLAISLVSVLRGDPNNKDGLHLPIVLVLIIALGVVSIPVLARITRASTLSWAERDFVTAARAQGAGHARILFREVLPNVIPAMFSISLLGMAIAIVAEGGLAILGVSVQDPQVTWGSMISDGKDSLRDAPFIVWIPVAAVFLTALSLNYLGDVVRDRFDVRESAL